MTAPLLLATFALCASLVGLGLLSFIGYRKALRDLERRRDFARARLYDAARALLAKKRQGIEA